MTTLASLGSGAGLPLALNNTGSAVGFYTDANGLQDPAVFNGAATQLGTSGSATGINDSGTIIGYTYTGQTSTVTQWSGGKANSLGISGAGFAINNSGEIAGAEQVSPTEMHAFTAQRGTVKDLGTLGGSWSSAYALNNAGTVAGTSTLNNGQSRAFISNGTALQSLGTLGGGNSYGAALSQNGMVAGTAQNSAGYLHAFIWNQAGMHDLGTLGGTTSSATGVNNAGWVVGSSTVSGNLASDGFLSINGTMFDLNSLILFDDGWSLTGAYAINNADEILATAQSGGQNYAVELRPVSDDLKPALAFANVPEPAALALTALGLVAVSRVRRRRRS